jgi:hypothetical protein
MILNTQDTWFHDRKQSWFDCWRAGFNCGQTAPSVAFQRAGAPCRRSLSKGLSATWRIENPSRAPGLEGYGLIQ